MSPPRHATKILSALVGLGLLACGWFLLAPSAIGGSTSWVVTDGISMEPRFHAGDLVLVRRQSDYAVGQIVAYHNRQLGTIVLHRIVARDGSRYVFKGDNNNFLDFEQPRRSQLIGALWVHLAGAGRDLESVRSPALVGGLFAIATLLFGGAAFTRHRRRRRRERGDWEPEASPRMPAWSAPGMIAVSLAAMLPFFVLALLAFSRPSSSATVTTVPYEQQGTISYSASTTPGAAYPDGRVVTGEPLFTHVVHAVDVRFAYRLQSRAAHDVRVRAWLTAAIASTSGWRTTIPLAAARTLSGGDGMVSGRLDLSSLLALVARVEAITSVRGAYTVTIAPQVRVSGALGGAPLHASYSPQAKFSLDQLELRPVTAAGSASEEEPSAAMFSHSEAGSVTVRRSHSSRLSLGPASISVTAARAISLAGLALVALALLGGIALLRKHPRDERAAILSRYGPLIVPVACVWQQPGVAVIDVAGIDALVKVAARYERSILHEQTEYGDAFWVTDESGQFRYAVWAAEDPAADGAQDQESYEEILAVDAREARRADTIEFGAASRYPTVLPQG